MAEIVLSALLSVLFEKLGSAALNNLARSMEIDSELKKLESSLSHIEAALSDAAQREIRETSVKRWLNRLQHLAYDIDDELDDLATEAMHRELSEESGARACKVRKLISTFFTTFSRGNGMSDKLSNITTKLQDLIEEKNTLQLVVKDGKPKTTNRSMQTSLVDAASIVGRQGDKQALLQQLLSDEQLNPNFDIVPIYGLGGVGKTTLAGLLYSEARVEGHFELKAWVCVSDEFDIFNITKSIFQSVGGGKEFADLNQLQEALREKLSNKRFLIVLDDVWSEEYEDWRKLEPPFRVGAPGSKIIITTRKLQLLTQLGYDHPYHLQNLSPDDALSLFSQHALGENNLDSHPTFKPLGEGIVKKCNGLPLALVALGRLLRTKAKEEWKDLLDSEIWRLEEGGIIPALRLSYLDLPAHLKLLFAYCSFFPKDYVFDKDELVLLWMAEGFLQQAGCMTMERVGHKCFQELLSRSFFQKAPDNESSYVMHDLMNDLATFVAGDFFFRLGDKMDVNNERLGKCRHMSFIRQEYGVYKKFMVLEGAKSLRTLLAVSVGEVGWRKSYLSNKILIDLIPQLPLLRVLNFSDHEIREIPESIGSLKHLRYLNLSRTRISHLPEQVGNLYNLQTLLLCGCRKLEKLPKSFLKLKYLRHLDITDTPDLKMMPLGIGKLKNLQTLSKVIIEGGNGFAITELKDLKDLHGRLSIKGLDKVQNAMDASYANLLEKELNELDMQWSDVVDGRNGTLEEEVLNVLKPRNDKLRKLRIVSYGGKEFPRWVVDASFNLLAHVTISGCKQCTTLPPLGRLPLLKELFVEGMDGVKVVDSELLGTSLEILSFLDMKGWEVWSTNNGDISRAFPCLRELRIKDCPNLVKVSLETLPSLRELDIYRCGDVALRSLVCAASSVTKLRISNILGPIQDCDVMRYLWESEAEACKILVNLRELELRDCKNLVRLGEKEEDNCGSSLPSLRNITISGCSGLERYSCPNSIETLIIFDCDSITSISFPTGGLKSLTSLYIMNCENLKSFPDHELRNLTSLTKMTMGSCPCMDDSFPRGLWPPNLSFLQIGGLKDTSGPQRYNLTSSYCYQGAFPSSLKTLRIISSEKLVSRSLGFRHLPSLQHLHISDCPNLRDLPGRLTSLQHLSISWCPNFIDLPETLTSLQHLNISSCLNFGVLPETVTSLRHLFICDCPNFGALPETLTSLQYLFISGCPNFRVLPETLTSLQHLDISCPNLRDLPKTLTSLQHVYISGCQNIRHLPKTLISLQYLCIINCPNLRDPPETLISLQHLFIFDCPNLRDLPEALLLSLLELNIGECPKLKERCSRSGSDWSRISHIPCIQIDGKVGN